MSAVCVNRCSLEQQKAQMVTGIINFAVYSIIQTTFQREFIVLNIFFQILREGNQAVDSPLEFYQ